MKTVWTGYGIFIQHDDYQKILQKLAAPLTIQQKKFLILQWDIHKSLAENLAVDSDREDTWEKWEENWEIEGPDFKFDYFGGVSIFSIFDTLDEKYAGIKFIDIEEGESMMVMLNSNRRAFSEVGTFEISELTDFDENEKIQLEKFMHDFDLDIEFQHLFYTSYI